MTDQNQANSANQLNRKRRPKPDKAEVRGKQANHQIDLAHQPAEPIESQAAEGRTVSAALLHGAQSVFGEGSVENQAARLDDSRLSRVQRQTLATEISRAQGNQHLLQLMAAPPAKSDQGVAQRSPASDELEKLSQGKSPAEIFALVNQQKFKDEAKKGSAALADLKKAIDRVLPDPDEAWVAKKILTGRLGMTAGIKAKDHSGLSKDIPSQRVEVHFFPGASEERALVIAGVHGSERQGIEIARMLIDDVLKKAKPHYTVIVVPSLFPDNAHPNWGLVGRREGSTKTNRNFPDLDQEVAGYKGGQALDAADNPVKDKKGKTILAENVMLMELIDRFQPARIISIHGTHGPSSAGVFADPHFLSPAKEKAIESLSNLFSKLWGWLALLFGGEEKDDQTRFDEVKAVLTEAVQKVDEARTQNDIDLAIATAYAIADKTAKAGDLKGRFKDKKNKKKQTTPSVAGNKLYKGAGKENAVWRADMIPGTNKPKPWKKRAKRGASLGLYGPAQGISVFTVEPPVNRALDYYDGSTKEPKSSAENTKRKATGPVVSKAQRETELKAYAEAVATILLGPDEGAEALKKHRPGPATTTPSAPATGGQP